MKRCIALILGLVLLLSCVAWAEESPFLGYTSNFSKNIDGWYLRGAGEGEIFSRMGELNINGCAASGYSAARDFRLTPGYKYKFTATVCQNQVDSAEIMLSIAYPSENGEEHKNLESIKLKKGKWTTLKGDFMVQKSGNHTFYIENTADDPLDFFIKNVVVEPAVIIYDMTLPSLAKAYEQYFDVGCAIGKSQVSGTKRLDFLANQFNIMTAENELKPSNVLDMNACRVLAKEDNTAVAVRFGDAKPLLDFCKEYGIKVHGHTLLWHQQTPDEFFREGYQKNGDYVSRDVMLARLDNYIRQIMEYMEKNYPGVIVSWDVVNEAVSDNSTGLRISNWTEVVGQDFVNRAFEIARKYAPEGTALYYNDYSTPYEPKLTGICNLLDSLIADGNIDGYGFQCHYTPGAPGPSLIRTAMQRISEKGLRLRVSELDIRIADSSDLNLRIQANRYKDLFKIFLEYADHIDAVQVWGVTDNRSWEADEFPLLFDGRYRPKRAFYSVLEAIQPPAN